MMYVIEYYDTEKREFLSKSFETLSDAEFYLTGLLPEIESKNFLKLKSGPSKFLMLRSGIQCDEYGRHKEYENGK